MAEKTLRQQLLDEIGKVCLKEAEKSSDQEWYQNLLWIYLEESVEPTKFVVGTALTTNHKTANGNIEVNHIPPDSHI